MVVLYNQYLKMIIYIVLEDFFQSSEILKVFSSRSSAIEFIENLGYINEYNSWIKLEEKNKCYHELTIKEFEMEV